MKYNGYYVYIWFIKGTNTVFYVGKGHGNRCGNRTRKGHDSFNKMVSENDCDYLVIKDGLTEQEAFDLEVVVISYYRNMKAPLINILDGGKNPPLLKGIPKSDEWKRKSSASQKKFYEMHPERKKMASEKMKAFFQTKEGKDFQRKSIESRNNDEFRKRQSEICKKANNTPEYKARQSEICKRNWLSESYRNAHCGANNNRARAVIQYDLEGNFIAEYETMTQADKETGVNFSRISAVCRGRRKTSGGYIWRYKEEALT